MLIPTDLRYYKFNKYFDQQVYLNKAAFLPSTSGIFHLAIDTHVYFSVVLGCLGFSQCVVG